MHGRCRKQCPHPHLPLPLPLDAQNAYFPLFITEEALTTEKDHVEGFAAEVWGGVDADSLE